MPADGGVSIPADATTEAIALALLNAVLSVERKSLSHGEADSADREWLLDTYAECLLAITKPQERDNERRRRDGVPQRR